MGSRPYETLMQWSVLRRVNHCLGLQLGIANIAKHWSTTANHKPVSVAWRDDKCSPHCWQHGAEAVTSLSEWDPGMCWVLYPTSGVIECGFSGLPSFSAVALIERQTLLSRPSYNLKVSRWIFRLTEVPDSVNSSAAGVGHVQDFPHRIHCQIVLVSRTSAIGEKKKKKT